MRGITRGVRGDGVARCRLAMTLRASGFAVRCPARPKQGVKDKLKELHGDLDVGLPAADGRYTVRQAVADWLREGLDGRSENTVTMNRHVLQPVVASLGRIQVRQLATRDVRRVLAEIAETRSSRTVVITHNALERVIRHAEANDHVRRNVVSLVRPPKGTGRAPIQVAHVGPGRGAAGRPPRTRGLAAYVVLCLLAGVRTEEARAHYVGSP